MGASNHSEDLARRHSSGYGIIAKYKPKAKFTTFLYTLARHAWLDTCASIPAFSCLPSYREEMPTSTSGGLDRVRRELDIQDALNQLTPKLREVLVLAVLQGLNYREIARVLHVPVGTVKSRVFNALATLRRIYHEKDAR